MQLLNRIRRLPTFTLLAIAAFACSALTACIGSTELDTSAKRHEAAAQRIDQRVAALTVEVAQARAKADAIPEGPAKDKAVAEVKAVTAEVEKAKESAADLHARASALAEQAAKAREDEKLLSDAATETVMSIPGVNAAKWGAIGLTLAGLAYRSYQRGKIATETIQTVEFVKNINPSTASAFSLQADAIAAIQSPTTRAFVDAVQAGKTPAIV